MTPGPRKFKSASLRIAIPLGIEGDDDADTANMREGIRELIDLQAGNRRKGHGDGLMRNVCLEADVEGKVLMLQVAAYDDGAGNEALQRWYSKLGFDVIQEAPVLLMARTPR